MSDWLDEYTTDEMAKSLIRVAHEAGCEYKAELAEITAETRMIMEEECPYDERHCTCVPPLRMEAKKLEAQLAEARKLAGEAATEIESRLSYLSVHGFNVCEQEILVGKLRDFAGKKERDGA